MTIDIDPDVHAQLAAAAAAAAKAGGRAVSYCDVIRGLLDEAYSSPARALASSPPGSGGALD